MIKQACTNGLFLGYCSHILRYLNLPQGRDPILLAARCRETVTQREDARRLCKETIDYPGLENNLDSLFPLSHGGVLTSVILE